MFLVQCALVIVLLQKVNLEYAGEDFPAAFLDPDGVVPSDFDMELYLDRLIRMSEYLTDNKNNTDVNQAFACFMTTAILTRTLLDYRNKIEKYKKNIEALIKNLTNVISHYRYRKNYGGWANVELRLSKVLQDVEVTASSLQKFRKGVVRKWIQNYVPMNDFIYSMDTLNLPKEKYVELVEATNGGFDITGNDSDLCLSRLVETMEPGVGTPLRPCKVDEFCRDKIFKSPSVAYSLSHRLFNNMMYMHARRCYHYTPNYDSSHMDMLCAAMYRETVYVARRGYFARDLFLEHIAFCGQLGHEEFHRRVWFHKAASWIDEDGCMQEFINFERNRTRWHIIKEKKEHDIYYKGKSWRAFDDLMDEDCHHHQMAVALMALANGVRYAAHFKV